MKSKVILYIFNEQWLEDRAPKSRSAFIDLVCQVQKTVAADENSRIAVHAQ